MERHDIEDRSRLIINSIMSDKTIAHFCSLIKSYRPCVAEHCYNVAFITGQVCTVLDLKHNLKKEIITGALLHDIGKIKIPHEILDKPSLLTAEEFDIVKKHPQQGLDIINEYHPLSEVVSDIVLHHHEIEDGAGYPHGIKNMTLGAPIVSIVDKYDAITEKRVYADAVDKFDTYIELQAYKERYGYFDEIIKALYSCRGN